uniref:Uncharacterized protein n=1 Tax=Glossina pallidipes TaxID=7398 RepID=A0A1A9ZJS1_GLOPL
MHCVFALSTCILCQLGHYSNWLLFHGCEVRTMPQYFALSIDLLALRYAKVINNERFRKNGSRVADTSVLSPSISLTMVILPAFTIAQKSQENASLYFTAFGLVAAKVANKLVIAHKTKTEIGIFGFFSFRSVIWTSQDLTRYFGHFSLEICAHLHIDLFAINQGAWYEAMEFP